MGIKHCLHTYTVNCIILHFKIWFMSYSLIRFRCSVNTGGASQPRLTGAHAPTQFSKRKKKKNSINFFGKIKTKTKKMVF